MAFAERALRFTFSGESTGTLSVEGLRAVVNLQSFPGKLGNTAQVKIWGLTMDQMNAYSSRMAQGIAIEKFNLTIEAGDVGGTMHKIAAGAIWRSFIDLTAAPESAFVVSMVSTIYQASKMIASQSARGPQNAEDAIQAICAVAGLKFHNSGAHAVLRNRSTYGSAIEQIIGIANAARFQVYLEGDDVWIYPGNGTRDDVVIVTGPDEGMIGYPEYWEAGIIVRTLFNPEIQIGRQMKVTSSIPKANGTWPIVTVYNDLATMIDHGPWFTTALLSTGGTN